MLIRNNTYTVQSLSVNLVFDDESEKHIKVDVKDIINVVYNDAGYRREIQGKVTQIQDNKHNYCSDNVNSSYITVDGSGIYAGKQARIRFKEILDLDMVEKFDESLFIKTVAVDTDKVTSFRIHTEENGDKVLQVSQDFGATWINANTLVPTPATPPVEDATVTENPAETAE